MIRRDCDKNLSAICVFLSPFPYLSIGECLMRTIMVIDKMINFLTVHLQH